MDVELRDAEGHMLVHWTLPESVDTASVTLRLPPRLELMYRDADGRMYPLAGAPTAEAGP